LEQIAEAAEVLGIGTEISVVKLDLGTRKTLLAKAGYVQAKSEMLPSRPLNIILFLI